MVRLLTLCVLLCVAAETYGQPPSPAKLKPLVDRLDKLRDQLSTAEQTMAERMNDTGGINSEFFHLAISPPDEDLYERIGFTHTLLELYSAMYQPGERKTTDGWKYVISQVGKFSLETYSCCYVQSNKWELHYKQFPRARSYIKQRESIHNKCWDILAAIRHL